MGRTSIIITTHNRPRLLVRAVESAHLAGSDLEIVIVNDALIWQSARSVRWGDLRQPLWNLVQLPRLHPLTLALIMRDRMQRLSTSNSSRFEVGAQANRRFQKLN